jgi:hypothetical protein
MDKSRTGAWPITETVFFLAAVLLSLLSVINLRIMNFCFSHFSYYLMLALFVWWLVASFLYAKESGAAAGAFWRAYGWGILLSFALAGVVFVSVRSDFRILADETNLLAISKSILYEKQVHNVTEGSFYYLNFNPIASEQIPKRPFLFPFLTSILHTLLEIGRAHV